MCISILENETSISAHQKVKRILLNASGGHLDMEHIIDDGYIVGGVDTIKTNKVAAEAEIWRERE